MRKFISTKKCHKAQKEVKKMNRRFHKLMSKGKSKKALAYFDSIKDKYEMDKSLIREYECSPCQKLLRALFEN